MALSSVATRAKDGIVFQAAHADGPPNATSEAGRCVAAITAVCLAGKSAANTWRKLTGSMYASRPGVPQFDGGHGRRITVGAVAPGNGSTIWLPGSGVRA